MAALLTACRYGELAGLRVQDVDFKARVIHVREGKGGKPRTVPLTEEGVDLLVELTAGQSRNALVLRREDGGQWAKSHQSGRTRDIVFPPRPEYTGPGLERVAAPEKMAKLSALPLFSEDTDAMLPLAYEEFKKCALIENFVGLQLAALNFLRVLAPSDVYHQEIKEFAYTLRFGYPHTNGFYFGAFPGNEDPGNRRKVLHEHLSAIMSPAAQRDLVGHIYAKWNNDVEMRRQAAVTSIYDEEIRSLFDAGDILAAYEAACKGEAQGIYRRDEGWGALTMALGGSETVAENIRKHLADVEMRSFAENWYNDYYASLPDDDDGMPVIGHLEAYLHRPPCE